MDVDALIEEYRAGAKQLRDAVAGFRPEEFKLRPVPGKWSLLEVVCHLADFEIVIADRIKRVIAEDNPSLPSGNENLFAQRLAYHSRDMAGELALVEAIRGQVAMILRTLEPRDFQRRGIHSEAGPLTLETLVQGAAGHVAHHLKFVAEKQRALRARAAH